MSNITTNIEKPVIGYIVITVALLAGMLAASAFAQNAGSDNSSDETIGGQVAPHEFAPVEMRIVPQQPNAQLIPRRRWILGVRADATDSGYLVRGVERHTTAAAIGLEPGDRIVAIDGQQVGYLGTRLLNLSTMLDRKGASDGRVRLLIQDRRNRRLVSMHANLRASLQQLGY